MAFNGISAKQVALGVAGAVYAADCLHVYEVFNERRQLEKNFDPVAQSKVIDELVYKFYDEDRLDLSGVSDEVFDKFKEEEVKHRAEQMEQIRNKERDPKEILDGPLSIQRESVLFLGGGIAALLQMSHPYVATGIVTHSNLAAKGVQARFYGTFKYMFAMIFGDPEESSKASKTVRRMHNRVYGQMKEDVGIFKKGVKYNANNEHAILWVHMTLTEGAVFMYEMNVKRLTLAEKNEFIAVTNRFGKGMFGLSDEILPKNWDDFQLKYLAVVKSNLLAVGSDCSNIDSFLWIAPKARYKPVMSLVRWSTFVMLPEHLQPQFYGRKANVIDRFFLILHFALVRFVYRLFPSSFRYLSSYMKFEERLGVERTRFEKLLSAISASLATQGLAMLMPERDVKSLK